MFVPAFLLSAVSTSSRKSVYCTVPLTLCSTNSYRSSPSSVSRTSAMRVNRRNSFACAQAAAWRLRSASATGESLSWLALKRPLPAAAACGSLDLRLTARSPAPCRRCNFSCNHTRTGRDEMSCSGKCIEKEQTAACIASKAGIAAQLCALEIAGGRYVVLEQRLSLLFREILVQIAKVAIVITIRVSLEVIAYEPFHLLTPLSFDRARRKEDGLFATLLPKPMSDRRNPRVFSVVDIVLKVERRMRRLVRHVTGRVVGSTLCSGEWRLPAPLEIGRAHV